MRSTTIDRQRRVLIGRNLRSLRQHRVLTQGQVARQLGVEQATLSRVERGKGVSLDLLIALARFYGESVDRLLSDAEAA